MMVPLYHHINMELFNVMMVPLYHHIKKFHVLLATFKEQF